MEQIEIRIIEIRIIEIKQIEAPCQYAVWGFYLAWWLIH